MESRIAATTPTSPVMPRAHRPPGSQPLTSHSRLDCMALPLASSYPLYNLLPVCLSGSFPTPPPPQALIGSEQDPASQGGGGIHRTCASGTSDSQVKARDPSRWVCGSPTTENMARKLAGWTGGENVRAPSAGGGARGGYCKSLSSFSTAEVVAVGGPGSEREGRARQ